MKYYKIDDKVFFNQDDLLEELKTRLAPDEQHLSDEYILRDAYMFEEYEEVEFNLYDCTFEDIAEHYDEGFVERWKHNATSEVFYIDVKMVRNEDYLYSKKPNQNQ